MFSAWRDYFKRKEDFAQFEREQKLKDESRFERRKEKAKEIVKHMAHEMLLQGILPDVKIDPLTEVCYLTIQVNVILEEEMGPYHLLGEGK